MNNKTDCFTKRFDVTDKRCFSTKREEMYYLVTGGYDEISSYISSVEDADRDDITIKFIFVRNSGANEIVCKTNVYSFADVTALYNVLLSEGVYSVIDEYDKYIEYTSKVLDLRFRVADKDDFKCRLCGRYMPDFSGLRIGHIIPILKGGNTTSNNLQVLCDCCASHDNDVLNFSYISS